MTTTDELRKIKDEVLQLTQSPLYSYRVENNYYPVIGEGSHSARIVFIGEAPGKQEALTGRPFCGASGKLLDSMLESIGLKRNDVYITNVVKDRPQDNRDPSREEIELYRPFLLRQIRAIQPEVIVTLGRFAMSEMLSAYNHEVINPTISSIHGTVIPLTDRETAKQLMLVPLYHPAVALYNGGMRGALLKDFEVLTQFL